MSNFNPSQRYQEKKKKFRKYLVETCSQRTILVSRRFDSEELGMLIHDYKEKDKDRLIEKAKRLILKRARDKNLIEKMNKEKRN